MVFKGPPGFELMCRTPELHIVHPGFHTNGEELMREAVAAYSEGKIPKGGLITHRFAPEELGKAYEMMIAGDESYIKGAVVFE
ncbi:MAG: hypothetical protein LBQ95_04315 [Lachnospiraceae bacterium]|jgi:threonine dehydrogenase-like Zn-dependent dehydrogenase|nr:hypothetical protein [Lachnospiraceae bacterium]